MIEVAQTIAYVLDLVMSAKCNLPWNPRLVADVGSSAWEAHLLQCDLNELAIRNVPKAVLCVD